MVIGIVGLGLIGGSFAKALKSNTNHKVLGYDISQKAILESKRKNYMMIYLKILHLNTEVRRSGHGMVI